MPSGLAKVLLFVKAAPVLAKRSLQNLIFGAVKHLALDSKKWSSPVALKIDGQTIPNFDPLASLEDLFV